MKKPQRTARGGIRQGGKATPKGGVKTTLNREVNGLTVDDKANGGVVEPKLQMKSLRKTKIQTPSEESALKVEKIDAAPGPEIKSAAAPTVVSGIAQPKAAPANAKQKPASKDDGRRFVEVRQIGRAAAGFQAERVRRLSGARRRPDRGDRRAGGRRLQTRVVRDQLLKGQDDLAGADIEGFAAWACARSRTLTRRSGLSIF